MKLTKLHCGILSSMRNGSIYYPQHPTKEYEKAFGELMCAGYVALDNEDDDKWYVTEEGQKVNPLAEIEDA